MKPGILAIDIGGSGLKADVVDDNGTMQAGKVRVDTPQPATPKVVVDTIVKMVKDLPAYDRISIGFPGVVRDGKVLTAANLGRDIWYEFPLADTLSKRLGGHPARLLNDADMQGYALIDGKGVELVITLGTGFGSALFRNGELMPHMELGHHPVHKDKTYDQYVGNQAFEKIGKRRWNARMEKVLPLLHAFLHADTIHIGGGNARELTIKLPNNVKVGSNDAGIRGGAALWRDAKPGTTSAESVKVAKAKS